MKKWLVSNAPVNNAEMTREFGEMLADILTRRGIVSMELAREYFGCLELSDPFLMSDMRAAVEVIDNALNEDKKITVFGDYDCDGTAAAAILYNYLEAQGADVEYYIPDRSEGYGMSIEALQKIVDRGTELVITVDNGITAVEEAKFLKEKGVELVITDHHRPGAELPECAACVDPHREDDASPFKDICGAVVVLKLLIAIEGGEADFVLENYADLAAVATIGDVMPLKGENRFIVQRGLENIRAEQHQGLVKLIKLALKNGCSGITATDIAFYVCPRINASGRMAHAGKAVELMLCFDDGEKASPIAEELCQLNSSRRGEEDKILADVEKMISDDSLLTKQRVIVLAGKGWHHGIVGIVCARILEKYGKPVIMISYNDGEARGSARSIEGFSIHSLLTACSKPLTHFGGHPGAGGFSLPTDKIEEFTELVKNYAREHFPNMPVPGLPIDKEVSPSELTADAVKALSKLEPFGEGNPVPVFLIKGCKVRSKSPMSEGKYTSFEIEKDGLSMRVVSFKIPFAQFSPKVGDKIDIVATARINDFKQRVSVELMLVDLRPDGCSEDKFFAAWRVYESLCRGEGCDKRLAPRVIPQSREELMKIYDLIRKYNGEKNIEELAVLDLSINFCMLNITIDAFAEAGMVEITKNGCPKIVPGAAKTDLFAQGLLARLKKELS